MVIIFPEEHGVSVERSGASPGGYPGAPGFPEKLQGGGKKKNPRGGRLGGNTRGGK